MKKKEEVENLIYDELNAEKPDESVLNAAKMQMTAPQTQSAGGGITENNAESRGEGGAIAVNRLAKRRAVAAVCALLAVAIILCCSLPLILRGEEIAGDDELTAREIESIKNYGGDLLYLDYDIESCVLYSDYGDSPVYILELYNDNQTQITLYVLLDTGRTDLTVFENFSGLSQSVFCGEVAVSYGICGGEYAAAFSFNDCNYYIAAAVDENQILSYARELLKAG